jgi:signal transduction histidine kinase
MEQLIHDLLHLSKVDADPRIERVPLPSVIQEVRSNLEVLLREKNARIEADPLPAIMADRTQKLQLFQNVIGNGIKYNESPEPLITISYRQGPTDALLSIADNGIGIPAEYRERAFQIFQRLPTAKQYQGTGIGLAICKKIVDGLGGTITISDREGGGTVFVISLPLTMVTVG